MRFGGELWQFVGFGFLLVGLAISLFGRYVPGGGAILPWVGLGFLVPALACFLLVLLNRLANFRRLYRQHQDLRPVLDGMGIAIISTSRGVMSDRQARTQRLGGELICTTW